MSETLSAKSYLNVLRKSEIVPAEKLSESLKRLSLKANGTAISLEQLTGHLLSEELITKWQNEQLLQGKHKGFFLGQYRLLRLLGSGGMSAVYLAQHMIANNLRAIKVLPKSRAADKSYLDRFYLEGRAAASLRHPNVAQIVDLANDGDLHYMVMELVEGIDLDQLVKQSGPLDYVSALDYVRQVADALRHAHSRNIIHRDIKPANIMVLNDRKTVKLLDLGLALMRDQETSLTIMHNEKVMGTADYLSPEQAIDSHKIDQRADIYSLGCTLYFLIAGHPPFPDGTIAQRIAKHQSTDPPSLEVLKPGCPISVARLCQKMMKKKAEERFANCQELHDAVQKTMTLISLDQKAKVGVAQTVQPAPVSKAASTAATPPANESSKPPVARQPAFAKPTEQPKPVVAAAPAKAPPVARPAAQAAPPSAPTNRPERTKPAGAEPAQTKPAATSVAPVRLDSLQVPEVPKVLVAEMPTGRPNREVKFDFAEREESLVADRAPGVIDLNALAENDSGSRTDFSLLQISADVAVPVSKVRTQKKKSYASALIVGAIIFGMFSILIAVLFILNKMLN
jgi:serine/threonine-protein kinase